ncbi:MAG: phosphatase PAP2 family protein, partial [Chitinophagales bacterium]
MLKKWQIAYNPYFLFPFLIWVVAGGILLAVFSRQDLFFAINTHYTNIGDLWMYYITWLGEGAFIVTVLVLLLVIPYFRNWWYFTTALFCNIIPFLIQQGLKVFFDAPRPRLLFYDKLWMHHSPGWPLLLHNSFPSGHSEGAFSFFCFLSLLLPARYNKLGFVFFLLAISVCYSRIYLAAHFFEDVYAGSILGGTMTMLIYSIMYK